MASDEAPVWLITGCSAGLGLALAEAVIAGGGRLVATARRAESLTELAARAPDRVRIAALDVTDSAAAGVAVGLAAEAFGGLDVLVNNAGYGIIGTFEEVDDESCRQQMETNFFGVLNVTRAALPLLRQRRGSLIYNISSSLGVSAGPALGLYCASKFALEGFSEALALEVLPLGVRVTLVEAGGLRTEFAGRSLQWTEPWPEYESVGGVVRERFGVLDGNQASDPVKAAELLVRLAGRGDLPLRLPLGADAVVRIRTKLDAQLADLADWAEVAGSIGYERVG